MATVPHVAVIAFPFASHAAKLFRLARALAAIAPTATFSFLSTAGSLGKPQKHHAAGALGGNIRLVEVPDGLPSGAAAVPPPHHMVCVELFLAAAEAGGVRKGLDLASALAGGARVSCVVGDAFVWMAAEAAVAVAAPWVPIWTGGPSALLVHLRGHALRRRADELLTSHPGLASYRVRDLPEAVLSGDVPILVMFRRMAERLPLAAAAVVLNTFTGLVPDDVSAALAASLPAECLPIGPFHLLPVPDNEDAVESSCTDPYGCLAWLDRHPARAVAYVSFGTIVSAMAKLEEMRELAAGMELSGAPFIWSLPEDSWPQLPPGFLDRAKAGAGLVVPWAPQVEVLQHASVGAFVTHAGWASVLEGVCGGVPMACRPFISDQMMNARMVTNIWAVGTVFHEPMTQGGVAAAVTSLLTGKDGDLMRERMQELKRMAARAFGGSRNNLDKLVKKVCALPSISQV